MATAKAVREQNMPCDVITLDGRAWQDTDTRFAFEWDPKRFANFPPSKVIGDLKAIRAVATANGANRIPIIIPCHRVIGSDGSLTGFGGGLWRKKYLLELESNQGLLF